MVSPVLPFAPVVVPVVCHLMTVQPACSVISTRNQTDRHCLQQEPSLHEMFSELLLQLGRRVWGEWSRLESGHGFVGLVLFV